MLNNLIQFLAYPCLSKSVLLLHVKILIVIIIPNTLPCMIMLQTIHYQSNILSVLACVNVSLITRLRLNKRVDSVTM